MLYKNKFFHIDMRKKLQSNMIIPLKNEPSYFGKQYLQSFEKNGLNKISSEYIERANILKPFEWREFLLEICRIEAPQLKDVNTYSRLNSFFAFQNIEDVHRYIKRSNFKGEANIYEVFTNCEPLILDMTILDFKFDKDVNGALKYFYRYWMGYKMDEYEDLKDLDTRGSLMEVLINEDVKIGELLDTFKG